MMNGCPRWSILALPLLAALGCSDPVPRPAQGDLNLSVQTPSTGGGVCPVTGRTYVVAAPPKYTAPTELDPGDRLIDGEHSSTIKCTVKGSSTYTFSGTITGNTAQTDRVNFSMSDGIVNMDKLTGTVSVGVFTTQFAATLQSPPGGCSVTVVNSNVKPGSLWAKVTCPTISDPSAPGKACSVGPTTIFVLENCDGS